VRRITMERVTLIENYPVMRSTNKDVVGEELQFYRTDSNSVIIHQRNQGFVPVGSEQPWVTRIRNISLPVNVKFFALLTPENDIKIYKMSTLNNKIEYSWADMMYLSTHLDLDVLSRELCP
jgi:hypothetical protein